MAGCLLIAAASACAAACFQDVVGDTQGEATTSGAGQTQTGGADASTTGTSGTSTGALTGTGTGTEGLSDATGATSSGTAAESESGEVPANCGNGVLDPDEACDDGNAVESDGCLSNCAIPRSCAEILAHAPGVPNGTYLVDPRAVGTPWVVVCDMELDGGGWTGFRVEDTCNGNLKTAIVEVVAAENSGIDDNCRPFAEYLSEGSFTYYMDIDFPPGFTRFFLRDYQILPIGEPELGFAQQSWDVAHDFPNGALSLGSGSEAGPTARWAADGGSPDPLVGDMPVSYPLLDAPFVVNPTTTLRIGWGEAGIYPEGLFPWWSGQIFVR